MALAIAVTHAAYSNVCICVYITAKLIKKNRHITLLVHFRYLLKSTAYNVNKDFYTETATCIIYFKLFKQLVTIFKVLYHAQAVSNISCLNTQTVYVAQWTIAFGSSLSYLHRQKHAFAIVRRTSHVVEENYLLVVHQCR